MTTSAALSRANRDIASHAPVAAPAPRTETAAASRGRGLDIGLAIATVSGFATVIVAGLGVL